MSLRSADVVVVLIDVGVVVFVVVTAAAAVVVVVVQVCNELSLSPITNHLPTLLSWSCVRFVTVFCVSSSKYFSALYIMIHHVGIQ